jgi:UDP-galactopyranose mutase
LSNRAYRELPSYLAGWDAAIFPVFQNSAQSLVSAAQIPQYLAAGCPVISTSIPVVNHCYGACGLVWLADNAAEFMGAIETALRVKMDRPHWLKDIDRMLADGAWEQAWRQVQQSIDMLFTMRQRVYVTA